MYKHILFPHDGSKLSTEAATECIAIAKCIGASITAIQVVRPPLFLEVEAPRDLRREIHRRFKELGQGSTNGELAELQRHAKEKGVEWSTIVLLGTKPSRDIVDHARSVGCDLIVMASHGRSVIDALLHGSETMKVLHHCKIPVLVLRPGCRHT